MSKGNIPTCSNLICGHQKKQALKKACFYLSRLVHAVRTGFIEKSFV